MFEQRSHTDVNVDNSNLEGNDVDCSFNEIISLQEVKNAIFKSTMGIWLMAWNEFPLRFCATIPLFTSYMCYSTVWGNVL